ncbi:hypothetical protein SEPCBS119000_006711 [Sporothrix epigloea]|uniref:Zn(2)-C6 fungal-type domain-containing protein n=1 Tax=Sporothrix epigloea TaxID=1892477 RepID=A0ABP0E7M9_9PEZI
MASIVRATALRAGGACVRCRKGKTKCVYENGRAPCKNCAKGMHECYLPSDSMSHGGQGVSPARIPQRTRESLPSDSRTAGVGSSERVALSSSTLRHSLGSADKLTPELIAECERVISKTLPACVAFHKPSFLQQIKNGALDPSLVHAVLTTASRYSPSLIRRYGGHGGGTATAEHFAQKSSNFVMQSLDHPSLGDIQALCLLVIHEWGCRNAIRAYIYLGQAARMAQMYRIVQVYQPEDPDNFLKEESFRRTLWLIYTLDCFLTSSPGRHPALSSLDIADIALPCQDTNFNFGSPVFVRTLSGVAPGVAPDQDVPLAEVGEFAYIVLAAKSWRSVVEMLTTMTIDTYSESRCLDLEAEIDAIRQSLPAHFADKPGQINLHVTMGSGFTYAMIHCLLQCATIFVNRRQLLQIVTAEDFKDEDLRNTSESQIVEKIITASQSIISMLVSLENGSDKDAIVCFPIVMLFSAFTAGSTAAYLFLKGLAPPDLAGITIRVVRDSLHLMCDGAESWPLVMPWNRHLTVMAKVLRDVHTREDADSPDEAKISNGQNSSYIKDDGSPQPETHPDTMDHDHSAEAAASIDADRGSEPPVPRRAGGIATINGGSASESTPAPDSPPPESVAKQESPESQGHANPPGHTVKITAKELCGAFERQLLELDDLAAFMGGGV